MRMYRHHALRLAALVAGGLTSLCGGATEALAETRTLKLYHLHTREKTEITFKRNGRYVQDGLRKANVFLRDWRRNEPTRMDPRLLDLLWQAYRTSGSNGYINVIGGYRAPATNSMLRGRSKGVAKNSQHMLGKAIDFYILDVPLKKLRDIGLRIQGGGVGYYPTSGSPFVHMDVGNVRHWPGISRQELARVFPGGKTLHVPSDGRPLPGYGQALAAYKSRGSGPTAITVADAGETGGRKSSRLLAALFGGSDEEEDNGATAQAAAPAGKPAAVTSAARSTPSIAIVPPEKAQRADAPKTAEPSQMPAVPEPQEVIVAALPPRDVPLPRTAPRPRVGLEAQTTVGAASSAAPTDAAEQRPTSSVPETNPAVAMAAASENPIGIAQVPLPTRRPQPAALPGSERPADIAADKQIALATARPNDGIKRLLESTALDEARPASMNSSASTVPARLDERATAPARASREGDAKTTVKQARAGSADSGPKAIAAPADPDAIRADGNNGNSKRSMTAPRFSSNFMRTAPAVVYVDGFRPNREMADAGRFSGVAVEFLPIARFE